MRATAFVAIFVGMVCAQDLQIAFLGMQRGTAPAFEQSLETDIRRELASGGQWPLVDSRRVRLMREAVGLDDHNSGISHRLIEELRRNDEDGTLVVWGKIENFDVYPRRRMLVGAEAVARADLVLNLYSLTMQSLVYVGRHEIQVSLRKPPVFFRRIEQATHINSRDRIELRGMVSDRVTPHVTGLVRAVARRVGPNEEELPEIEDVEKEHVPTVQDLFDFPGMEAESVEEELPTDEPQADTEEQTISSEPE